MSSELTLYDAPERSEWYWPKNVAAPATFATNPNVVAVTLGSDQFYRSDRYPSTPGSDSIALIAHETVHSLHAELTTSTAAFLIGYGIDSFAAYV